MSAADRKKRFVKGKRPIAIDVPCRTDPAVDAIVQHALPCPDCKAENEHLRPMRSAGRPRVFAIGCYGCGYIGDDAATLADAVAQWNCDHQRH
jgi:hypothetical protein